MRIFLLRFKLNRVIWLLTCSDIFSWGIYSSISALTGIYLSTRLGTGVVEIVGVGMGIFYLSRSIFQIPIGLVTDKIKKDRDDIIFLVIGNLMIGFPLLFYPVIQAPIFYFLLQVIFGIGAAMNLVTWRKLFARNLETDKEGLSYALYDTVMSGSIALFSIIAGVVANMGQEEFDLVIMIIGFIIMMSSILPALIFDVKERQSNI